MNPTETLISRQDILDAAERIDPLPASVTRLLSIVANPDNTRGEVVDVIRYDPALSGDVLKRANSTMYAVRNPISDVGEAVGRMGTSTVVGLALARAMRGRLSSTVPAYGLEANALWTHSLAATVSADAISQRSPAPMTANAGTAALLHDIGKRVIGDCLPPALNEALRAAATNDDVPLPEVEREILGVDHGEVGALVARTWGLPVPIQIALTQHHHKLDQTTDALTHVVVAANAIAHSIEDDDDGAQVLADRSVMASLGRCGIDKSEIGPLVTATAERFSEVLTGYE